MPLARLRSLLLVPFAAAVVATGCGRDTARLSPTAPTDLLGSTTSTSELHVAFSPASSAGDLTVREDASSPAGHQAGGSFRELSGFVTEKGTDSLTVRGTIVTIEHATLIRHGHRILTLADIRVGDHVQVRGVTDGETLIAGEIKVEDTDRGEGDDDSDDVKGLVSALAGTCPNLTFTVGAIAVTTDGTTEFRGTPCEALVNGARVDVQGTPQADGSIVATKVDIKLGEDEVRGAISGLSGTCPTLTFTVGTTPVTTSSFTEFKGRRCAAVANGLTAEAKGTRQTDGSIVAVKIDVRQFDDDDDIEGTVSELSGTCPNLTFAVGTTRVTTNDTTEFKGAACTALVNGTRIEAEGTRQADGSIAATKIEVDG